MNLLFDTIVLAESMRFSFLNKQCITIVSKDIPVNSVKFIHF